MMVTDDTMLLAEPLVDVKGLERKANDFERIADGYMTKAAALRQIVAGVRALNGEADAVLTQQSFQGITFEMRQPDEHGPRGPRAVLHVMASEPERVWKVIDLKREILRRGWAPTPKAVEASIRRLRLDGKLEQAGYGFYKLPAPGGGDERIEEVVAA